MTAVPCRIAPPWLALTCSAGAIFSLELLAARASQDVRDTLTAPTSTGASVRVHIRLLPALMMATSDQHCGHCIKDCRQNKCACRAPQTGFKPALAVLSKLAVLRMCTSGL